MLHVLMPGRRAVWWSTLDVDVSLQTRSASIQDFDTIVSFKISLKMESLKMCNQSLISMEIDTFDRLRSGLKSFHGELLLIRSLHKR